MRSSVATGEQQPSPELARLPPSSSTWLSAKMSTAHADDCRQLGSAVAMHDGWREAATATQLTQDAAAAGAAAARPNEGVQSLAGARREAENIGGDVSVRFHVVDGGGDEDAAVQLLGKPAGKSGGRMGGDKAAVSGAAANGAAGSAAAAGVGWASPIARLCAPFFRRCLDFRIAARELLSGNGKLGGVDRWGLTYLVVWLLMNIVITLYCKAVFARFNFPYPMLLTATHMGCTALGVFVCRTAGVYTPRPSSAELRRSMVWFSVVFTVNIWLSNASLMEVSVNLHQVVRTIIPLVTMVLSALFFGERYSLSLLPPVMLVIAGVACTVWGDLSCTAFGLFVVLAGCVFSSLKGIITQKSQVGALGLSTLDLLGRVCPLAVVELLVMACVLGETRSLIQEIPNMEPSILIHLTLLGCVAFLLNFVSFRCAALLNPLTLNIAGNVKQVVTCLLSMEIFGGSLTPSLMIGIFATAIGAFWYSKAMTAWRQRTKTESHAANPPTVTVPGNSRDVPVDEERLADENTELIDITSLTSSFGTVGNVYPVVDTSKAK